MYFQCTHYSTGCINRWVPQSATGKPVLGKVVCKVSCDDGDVFVYPLCLLCFYFFMVLVDFYLFIFACCINVAVIQTSGAQPETKLLDGQ